MCNAYQWETLKTDQIPQSFEAIETTRLPVWTDIRLSTPTTSTSTDSVPRGTDKKSNCTNSFMKICYLQGGVVLVSHDQHLIKECATEVWLCKDKTVYRLEGGLEQYRRAVEGEFNRT